MTINSLILSYVHATIEPPECNVLVLASTDGQFLRVIIKVQSRKNKHPVVVIATRSDQVQFWQDFAKQRTTVGDKTGTVCTVSEYRSPNQVFSPTTNLECVKSQDSIRRL